MSISACCLKGFEWGGVPTGRVDRIADIDVYVAGDASAAAACGILIVHDLLGWKYPNARLLADHYAREIAGAAVYVPDFFAGEALPAALVDAERWSEIDDMAGFMGRNSREAREPLIFTFAQEMRRRHAKVGAVGFCYGGWAAFRLGAPGDDGRPPLADCISVGHPSLLTTADIDAVRVPVQILAPEVDPVYTAELKRHTFEALQSSGVPFDYQHFPGVGHACLVRGDEKKDGERAAMVRGKKAVVSWMKHNLLDE